MNTFPLPSGTSVGYQRPNFMSWRRNHFSETGSKAYAVSSPMNPWTFGMSYALVPPATRRVPSGRNAWPAQKKSAGVNGMANPPFLKQTKLEDAEAIAREIAYVTRGALKDPSTASTVDVVLTEKTGFGVTFAKNRTFSFTADELIGGR